MLGSMCGRYTITTPVDAIGELFGADDRPNLEPRWNVAPTQRSPVVRRGEDGRRRLDMLTWGLVPFWAKDRSIGSRMIMARGESIAVKPAFREAFRQRRCLVVADGFYEWARTPEGKQPYAIRRRNEGVFAFAGLWERWRTLEGSEVLETFAIVTTGANATLRPIHPRMPVVLDAADHVAWLEAPPEKAITLVRPAPEDMLQAYQVSTRVNSVRNDDPTLIRPADVDVRSDDGSGGEQMTLI